MRGGANPRRVRDAMAAGLARAGVEVTHEILTAVIEDIESSGYRIVRAGQVPRLDELEHAVSVLDLAAESLGLSRDALDQKVRDLGAANAAGTITMFRALAANVLDIDMDDVDELDEVVA